MKRTPAATESFFVTRGKKYHSDKTLPMHLQLLGTAKLRAKEALRAKPDRNMLIF